MKTPSSRVVAVAAGAVILATAGGSAAVAGGMIGSSDIRNGGVHKEDIGKNAVNGWRVIDGSLQWWDLSADARGRASKPGPAGKDGQDGAPGKDGEPGGPQGEPGKDGIDGKDGAPGADGQDGANGADGAPGTSVTSVACSDSSATFTLTFTMSDGTEQVVECTAPAPTS